LTHTGAAVSGDQPGVECPVCGCGECRIGR
jgi:hypothetical protein